MDLTGISNIQNINSNELQQLSNLKKEENEVQSFSEALDNAINNKDEKQLKKACVEFESYFLNMMFKSMRKTVIPAVEKSNAEQLFQEMLDEQVCKDISNSGGIGFADMMYTQLSKQI